MMSRDNICPACEKPVTKEQDSEMLIHPECVPSDEEVVDMIEHLKKQESDHVPES